MCSECDFAYAKRLGDGQCYGKYFISNISQLTRKNRCRAILFFNLRALAAFK